jgi:hypothetical protein
VFYTLVEFGNDWTGTRFGVYVMVQFLTASRPQECQFRMPEADIAELRASVRDGRRRLNNSTANKD